MIPLSLAHLSELAVPPLALVDLAAEAGFTSIGLRMMAAAPGGIEYKLQTKVEQSALHHRCAKTGIAILYGEMIGLSRTTDMQACRAMIDAAAAIGATRIAVAGDDPDPAITAARMAEICDIASPLGLAVDIEFMPFRATASLAEAIEVVRRAARPNAHILLDALHFFRSGSSLATLRAIDPALLGTVQLCDAPATPPCDLATEARTARLFPGEGGLDLRGFMAALPDGIPLGVELPIAGRFPTLTPIARAKLMVARTHAFLSASAK